MPFLPSNLLHWTPQLLQTLTALNLVVGEGGAVLQSWSDAGVVTSPPTAVVPPCTTVCASWAGRATGSSTIELALRAEYESSGELMWTRWWTMAVWSENPLLRHSVSDQADTTGTVATDTLRLNQPCRRLQWRATLRTTSSADLPLLRGLTLASTPLPAASSDGNVPSIAPLSVPAFSQMLYPNGGRNWCSPTAVGMVLAHWAAQTGSSWLVPFTDPSSVPTIVVPAVYDPVYDGTGNWAFNTAWATTLGMHSFVAYLPDLAALASWLERGIPVIASVRWRPGTLPGAPIEHSNGHLVVVTGLTPSGEVAVNDPAADPRLAQSVACSYPADQWLRAWQGGSGGAVYLIYPTDWPTGSAPVPAAHDRSS
ncbi:MAG: peptidase C39 family protein [Herpetosiphon sp.]